MSRAPVFLAVAAAVTAAATGAATAASPPGATALCRDGTYSFSKHHSGTCSHHGGVAKWLDGSGNTKTNDVALGRTVRLQRATKTSGCRLAARPDRRCSPGAYYSRLTKAVICSSSFHTGAVRDVPQSEKYAVEQEYGLRAKLYGRTLEIDHIVSLELGGSNDIANLYPEEARFRNGSPGYRIKDKLENRLHDMVCAGQISLRSAQRQIAADWEKLYRNVFGVAAAPKTG